MSKTQRPCPPRPPDVPIEEGQSTSGSIASISDRGFGWIVTEDDREFFFHASGCTDFESLDEGDEVQFTPTLTTKGPRAIQVRRANASEEA